MEARRASRKSPISPRIDASKLAKIREQPAPDRGFALFTRRWLLARFFSRLGFSGVIGRHLKRRLAFLRLLTNLCGLRLLLDSGDFRLGGFPSTGLFLFLRALLFHELRLLACFAGSLRVVVVDLAVAGDVLVSP